MPIGHGLDVFSGIALFLAEIMAPKFLRIWPFLAVGTSIFGINSYVKKQFYSRYLGAIERDILASCPPFSFLEILDQILANGPL